MCAEHTCDPKRAHTCHAHTCHTPASDHLPPLPIIVCRAPRGLTAAPRCPPASRWAHALACECFCLGPGQCCILGHPILNFEFGCAQYTPGNKHTKQNVERDACAFVHPTKQSAWSAPSGNGHGAAARPLPFASHHVGHFHVSPPSRIPPIRILIYGFALSRNAVSRSRSFGPKPPPPSLPMAIPPTSVPVRVDVPCWLQPRLRPHGPPWAAALYPGNLTCTLTHPSQIHGFDQTPYLGLPPSSETHLPSPGTPARSLTQPSQARRIST